MAVVRRSLILFALTAALAAGATTAFAASPTADCNSHGQLTHHYSVAQLHTALATMPADVQEYTNCYNVIQNQLAAQIAGHRIDPGTGSGGGGGLSTPLVVTLIVLVVGGGGLAGWALQRRGGAAGGS